MGWITFGLLLGVLMVVSRECGNNTPFNPSDYAHMGVMTSPAQTQRWGSTRWGIHFAGMITLPGVEVDRYWTWGVVCRRFIQPATCTCVGLSQGFSHSEFTMLVTCMSVHASSCLDVSSVGMADVGYHHLLTLFNYVELCRSWGKALPTLVIKGNIDKYMKGL